MNTYRYKTWSGSHATVQAASVEFGSAYVVFRDVDGRVVLAEQVANVAQLTNDAAEGDATRRPRPPATA